MCRDCSLMLPPGTLAAEERERRAERRRKQEIAKAKLERLKAGVW